MIFWEMSSDISNSAGLEPCWPDRQPVRPPVLSPLLLVTGNRGKVRSAARFLGPLGIELKQTDLPLVEIQDLSVARVASHKAWAAWQILRRPLVVEDGAFCIDELGGFPGPFAKYLVQTAGPLGIIRLADLTESRAAHFESALVYVDNTGAHMTFTDNSQTGWVAEVPSGARPADAWSGIWDVWVPLGCSVPLSALSEEQREVRALANRTSSVFGQFSSWLGAADS
jgi:non-canonical purine NTP pyrophosphatase (RdgB/HAM1 family)